MEIEVKKENDVSVICEFETRSFEKTNKNLSEGKRISLLEGIDLGIFHVRTDYIEEDKKSGIALGHAYCDCMVPHIISNRKYLLCEIETNNIISGEIYFLVIPGSVIVRQVCYSDWGYFMLKSSNMRETYSDFRIAKHLILRVFKIIGETNITLENKADISIII